MLLSRHKPMNSMQSKIDTELANPSAALEGDQVRAWLSVVRTYQCCHEALTLELRPLSLKMPEFEILLSLLRHGAQSQQQLASNGYVVKSHMSGLLAQLEKTGWIQRQDGQTDKRHKRVSLTTLGHTKALDALQVQRKVMLRMFSPLSASDIAHTESVMLRVEAALRDGFRAK
jgi:DNA-binding MarR family transcriptional regulator